MHRNERWHWAWVGYCHRLDMISEHGRRWDMGTEGIFCQEPREWQGMGSVLACFLSSTQQPLSVDPITRSGSARRLSYFHFESINATDGVHHRVRRWVAQIFHIPVASPERLLDTNPVLVVHRAPRDKHLCVVPSWRSSLPCEAHQSDDAARTTKAGARTRNGNKKQERGLSVNHALEGTTLLDPVKVIASTLLPVRHYSVPSFASLLYFKFPCPQMRCALNARRVNPGCSS